MKLPRPVSRSGRLLLCMGYALSLELGCPGRLLAEEVRPEDARAEPWGSWQAPVDCISESELMSRVEQAFVDREVPGNRFVAGVAEKQGQELQVRFSVSERSRPVGERVLALPAEDCRSQDETIVLVLALLLEHGPSEKEREVSNPKPPLREAPPPSPPPNTEEPQASGAGPATPAVKDAQRHVSISVGYVLDRGWTKASVGGSELNLLIHLPWQLRVGATGAYLPPRTSAESEGEFSVKSWGGYIGGNVCLQSPERRLTFMGCLVGGPLFLSARGIGVDRTQRAAMATGFLGARAEGRAQLASHFFIFFSGQIARALRPFSLVVVRPDVIEIVYENAPAWGGFSVGAGLTY